MAFLVLPAAAWAQPSSEKILSAPAIQVLPRDEITIRDSDGIDHVINVEVALNEHAQAQGLMGRQRLAHDAGMLFYFGGGEYPRYFWMKDTLIPLDILFIRADGTISHIHANAAPMDENLVPSMGPVAAVIELNGGAAAGFGIREGDRVSDLKYFKNQTVR